MSRSFIERIIFYVFTALLGIIGVFLMKTMSNINSSIVDIDDRLTYVERKVDMNTQKNEHLQSLLDLRLKNIEKQQSILINKVDQYDKNLQDIFKNYDLNPR